jgi:hypothetical protein
MATIPMTAAAGLHRHTGKTAAPKKEKRDAFAHEMLKGLIEIKEELRAIRNSITPSAAGIAPRRAIKPVDFKAQRDRIWGADAVPTDECTRVLAYNRGYIELEELLNGDSNEAEKPSA